MQSSETGLSASAIKTVLVGNTPVRGDSYGMKGICGTENLSEIGLGKVRVVPPLQDCRQNIVATIFFSFSLSLSPLSGAFTFLLEVVVLWF